MERRARPAHAAFGPGNSGSLALRLFRLRARAPRPRPPGLHDERATEERLRLACSAAYRRLKGACKCPGQSHAALALMSKADPKSPDNDLHLPTSSFGRSRGRPRSTALERACTAARAVASAAVAVVTRVRGIVVIPVGGNVGIRISGSIIVSVVGPDIWIAKSAFRVINPQISAPVGVAKQAGGHRLVDAGDIQFCPLSWYSHRCFER